MRGIVTISRHWDNPRINTAITNEQISLRISMVKFIEALKAEMGSVTWVFKKETFDKMVDQAAQRVIEKIKEESVKIV